MGIKNIRDNGYNALEILQSFYGDNIYIDSSRRNIRCSGILARADLTIGSTEARCARMQEQLNTISITYPLIPKINADGIYGEQTADGQSLQKVFKLPQTGVVDYPTWYKISEIFVGVSRIAELDDIIIAIFFSRPF